jgi:tetratricopeptide (TPR) repeat protein
MSDPTTSAKPPSNAELLELVKLYESGRYQEALHRCDELSVGFAPVSTVWQVKGAIHDKLGEFDIALSAKEQALALAPSDTRSMNNLANSYHRFERFEDARILYEKAISGDPTFVEAYSGLGSTLNDLRSFSDAKEILTKAVSLNPAHVHALRNLGNTYKGLGQLELAIEMYRRCTALDSGFVSAFINLTAVLFDLGRFSEAVEAGRKAVSLAPDSSDALSNLGNALHEVGLLEEAEQVLRRSIEINGRFAAARYNLANVLFEKGSCDEAVTSYSAAISLSGGYQEAAFNRGIVNLLLGRYAEGFRGYNVRFACQKNDFLPIRFKHEASDSPPSIDGARVAVFWEQGLGDTIQFIQLLPRLIERAQSVVFFCQPKLLRLLRSFQRPGLSIRSSSSFNEQEPFDVFIPLLSVPWVLSLEPSQIGSLAPYLASEPERVQRWSPHVDQSKFVVGICWQGSNAKIDKGRSFPLSYFGWLLESNDFHVVSLHKGSGEAQIAALPSGHRINRLDASFDSGSDALVDTAAVIQLCDLVISSDTAVAHLAGALGAPAWIALQAIPDWRWGLEGDGSAWYPSVKLFRQASRGNWGEVFEKVRASLNELKAAS